MLVRGKIFEKGEGYSFTVVILCQRDEIIKNL